MAKCANKTIIPISTKKGLNPPVLINDLKYLNIINREKRMKIVLSFNFHPNLGIKPIIIESE